MTNNFKEADDEFQKIMADGNNKLMKKYNNKLVTTNGQILPDSDEVKCEGNKGLSGYNKKIEEITKEGEEIIKEIAKEIAKEIITSIELDDEKTKKQDNITSPKHYVTDKGFEVFDVQEAFIHELKGMSASYWCNIVKYILRFQMKNGVEDLKKAKYYLDKLINEVEK